MTLKPPASEARTFLVFNVLVVLLHLPLSAWLIVDSGNNETLPDAGAAYVAFAAAVPIGYLLVAYTLFSLVPTRGQLHPGLRGALALISISTLAIACLLEGLT